MPLYKMDTIFKKGQKKKDKKFLFLNKRRRWLKAIIRTCNDYKTTKLNFT